MASEGRIALELRAGPLGAGDVAVTRVDGREGLSEPYAFDVEVVPRDGEPFDLEAVLGREAVLSLRRPTGEARVVHGEALGVELAGVAAGVPRYRITIAPRLARLGRVVRSRVFVDASAAEVVEALLAEHGIARRSATSSSCPTRDMIVQHRESDLAFVSRLLEQEGIWYRFEHAEDGHTLVLADAPGAYAEGGGPLPHVRAGGRAEAAEAVSRLERSHRLVPGAVTLGAYDFERPALDLTARAAEASAPEAWEWPGGHADAADGKRRARLRLEELRHGAETWEAIATSLAVEPGRVIEVEGGPRVLVVRARHRATAERSAGALEAVKVTYENALEGIDAGATYRPRRRTPAPRIAGIQTATVVGPADEEIHPDRHGRVKVQFHWDRDGEGDDRSSAWVRVAQAWAGGGMGASFVPRAGQEVVVRFLEGDPDRPLVTGAVYNGANPPPVELPAARTQSTLRTDSSPGSGGANELRFEDEAGREEVFLHAERDRVVEVEADETREIRGAAALSVEKDREVTVLGAQELEVRGEDQGGVGGMQTLTVAGARETATGGAHREQVAALQTVNVGGSQQVSAAAASAVFVGAAAALNVGGGYAVSVGGAVNAAVVGVKASQVGGESLIVVGAHAEERVGKEREAAVGEDDEARVDGAVRAVLDGDALEDVTGSVTLSAGPRAASSAGGGATVEADALTIEVGGKQVLRMERSGNVTLNAAGATVEGETIALKGQAVKKIALDAVDPTDDWVEVVLVDDRGEPVGGVPFELHLANGSVKKGTLDSSGRGRADGLPAGTCRAVFPRPSAEPGSAPSGSGEQRTPDRAIAITAAQLAAGVPVATGKTTRIAVRSRSFVFSG